MNKYHCFNYDHWQKHPKLSCEKYDYKSGKFVYSECVLEKDKNAKCPYYKMTT